MDKKLLITTIIAHLNSELATALLAAKNAHLAAIDEQSIAETQYDTLAIEAAYLAQGLSLRIQENKDAIILYENLSRDCFSDLDPIQLGSMVQLSQDVKENKWYFIGPASGGFTTKLASKSIVVVSPQSPLGAAFVGKYIDDEINLTLGKSLFSDYISASY